jgi:chloramphenicol-sensitive protein RarD
VHRNQQIGLQAALLAYTLWGLLTIYWKQLAHLDAFEMIGWRIMATTALMVVVIAARRGFGPIRAAFGNPPARTRIVLAALLVTTNWTTYVWAIGDGRVVETALGYFLAPLGTVAVGATLLGESLSRLQLASVAAAIVAVVVLTVSYGQVPWVALILAASWTGYGTIKRGVPLRATDSLTSELLVVAAPAALVAASGWFRDGGVASEASGVDWVLIAGTGVITALPLVLFAFAATRVPFTLLGPCNYLIPIINFLLGWLVYDEGMPPSRFVGFAFVWLALVLVTVHTLRADREPAPTAVVKARLPDSAGMMDR